ncbi:MAG: sodium:solute symporter [Pirellulales bacterium]
MPDAASDYGVLVALVAVMAISVWLGTLAHRTVERGSFLKGFFLGNRGLGVWALALTVTVQSGGTFLGFPSLVYNYGWIVALWIASYMVVPITGFALLGKRIAQISRRTGTITVPDLLRERFASPAVGLISSLIIILFMSFMLVAQFKGGALVLQQAWPGEATIRLPFAEDGVDPKYYFALLLFSLTVIGYTLIGGFLASVWTDLFQSVLMFFGVAVLAFLAFRMAGGLEHATRAAIEQTGPEFASGPGYSPGGTHQFFPVGLALSYFFLWVFTGVGSPASLVRLMASEDTGSIRRSIIVLSIYNMCIYLPLIGVAIAARALMPSLDKPDEMIPRMAILVTEGLPGGSLVSGLILAAPFGAVMATVSTYLVVIASGLVRDVYQRFLHPHAGERAIRRVTHGSMIAIGVIAVAANIKPVDFLQAIVVFSTSGAGAALFAPAMMTAHWRRATAPGVVAAMLSGSGTVLALFIAGWVGPKAEIGIPGDFAPYFLLGLEPIVWGLAVSAIVGVVVSLLTQPPPEPLIRKLFDAPANLPSGARL